MPYFDDAEYEDDLSDESFFSQRSESPGIHENEDYHQKMLDLKSELE